MDAVLEVSDISKRFPTREAVRSVSFTVARGEIFGLLGPNGAGKTTTVSMLAGIEPPTGGAIRLLGIDVTQSRSARRHLGLVPQETALYPALTAGENLEFFGRLYGLSARPSSAGWKLFSSSPASPRGGTNGWSSSRAE